MTTPTTQSSTKFTPTAREVNFNDGGKKEIISHEYRLMRFTDEVCAKHGYTLTTLYAEPVVIEMMAKSVENYLAAKGE